MAKPLHAAFHSVDKGKLLLALGSEQHEGFFFSLIPKVLATMDKARAFVDMVDFATLDGFGTMDPKYVAQQSLILREFKKLAHIIFKDLDKRVFNYFKTWEHGAVFFTVSVLDFLVVEQPGAFAITVDKAIAVKPLIAVPQQKLATAVTAPARGPIARPSQQSRQPRLSAPSRQQHEQEQRSNSSRYPMIKGTDYQLPIRELPLPHVEFECHGLREGRRCNFRGYTVRCCPRCIKIPSKYWESFDTRKEEIWRLVKDGRADELKPCPAFDPTGEKLKEWERARERTAQRQGGENRA
jgi:hypothetical protein